MILWAFTEHASQQRKRVTDRAIPSRDLSPQSTFTPHDWTRLWAMMEPVVLRHAHAFKQQVSWAPLTRIAEMPVPPPPPPVMRVCAVSSRMHTAYSFQQTDAGGARRHERCQVACTARVSPLA